MESKYLQMLMVYGFCVVLKIKLLIPPEGLLQLLERYYFLLTFIGASNVYMLLNYIVYFQGPIISTFGASCSTAGTST